MRSAAGGWLALAGAIAGRRPTLDEIAWGDRVAVHAAVRLLARTAPLADGDLVCRVLGRRKMVADGGDLSLTPHLALDGCWEMPLTRVLLRLLRPGMRVADVGANIGWFTLLMAEAIGPSGRVEAFEPNPRALDRLRRNLLLNGFTERVGVHAAPLGAVEGEPLLLHFDPALLGGGHVGAPSREGLERVAVTGRRLDGVVGTDALDLVKIDVEGSEAAVWAGMSGLLAGTRLRTVILEWQARDHADPAATLAGYMRAGFSLRLVDRRDGLTAADPAALLALPPGVRMLVLQR